MFLNIKLHVTTCTHIFVVLYIMFVYAYMSVCCVVVYAEHLHKPSYRVILYHALENMFAKDISAGRLAEYDRKCEQKTAALTELYTKLAEDRQIEVEIRVEKVGVRPEHAISDFINQEKPKFVVTGTRGVGVVRRTILGSTSDFILHHANCPVVICTMEDH